MKRPFVPAVCRSISLPPDRRVLAVSDIHGHLDNLKSLLSAARFSPDDILILLGDLVEKGPKSMDTVRYVLDQMESHTIYAVSGNCDGVLWDDCPPEAVFEEMERFGSRMALVQMAEELGFSVRSPADLPPLWAACRTHFARELAFLNGLPTILESETYLFVHGGVPREGRLDELDRWSCMKNDDFVHQGHSFSKWCVVGHWPATLYRPDVLCYDPWFAQAQKIASIDGGCVIKSDGQLNALVLPPHPDGHFTWFRSDLLPRRIALDGQPPSPSPFSFKWGDNEVDLLRREGDIALCRHCSTGRELWLPAARLWSADGRCYSSDATDYALPVLPGDALSIVQETSRGVLAKKDGVTGWYYGRLGGSAPVLPPVGHI